MWWACLITGSGNVGTGSGTDTLEGRKQAACFAMKWQGRWGTWLPEKGGCGVQLLMQVLGCPLNRKEAGALGYMKIEDNNEATQWRISYRLDFPKLLRQVSKDRLKTCFSSRCQSYLIMSGKNCVSYFWWKWKINDMEERQIHISEWKEPLGEGCRLHSLLSKSCDTLEITPCT